jgi:glycolate oxidase FAD binding subunit
VACNFSGPRRAYAGAARDFVLGCKIINGKGEMMSFGGEVMKNVAGYDVSRLMAGAMGTLGVIIEVSLKVLPLPKREVTLVLECGDIKSLENMHRWARSPLPITATCYDGDRLFVRLGASEEAVSAARKQIGGEVYAEGEEHWRKIREHKHAFFDSNKSLWRLSVASSAPPIKLEGNFIYEWGGALRWLKSDADADVIRAAAASAGGHAILFRGQGNSRFHPLDNGLLHIHQKLKYAFDPQHILNPGRMYADI